MPGFGPVSAFAVSELWLTTAGGDALASGSFATVSIATQAGAGSGNSSTSGAFVTVTADTQDGNGSGGADASGGSNTITVSAAAGSASASGSITATGDLVTVAVTAQFGSSTGGANGISGFDSIPASAPLGTVIGNASISSAFQTVNAISLDGSSSGSGTASGQSFNQIPISWIKYGNSSTLGDGLLGDFTPGDNLNSGALAVGSAVVNTTFTTVTIVSQNGSAKSFNPPSWARSRIKRLTIATSYVKKVNNPRAVEFAKPMN